jgi:fructose/tagatose bisphosphate aldolase
VSFIAMITVQDADFKSTTVSGASKLIKCGWIHSCQPAHSFLMLIFGSSSFSKNSAKKKINAGITKINIHPPSVVLRASFFRA